MIEALVKFLAAYLLGNIMGGQLIGWLRGGVDLRKLGSGNVGATNALRTQGPAFALAVLLIDVIKGVTAVLLIPAIHWPWLAPVVLPQQWIAYLCGLGVALGHCFPPLLGFHGGKGVAALAGVFGALMPAAFGAMLVGFILTVVLTGYASLATLVGAFVVVAWTAAFEPGGLDSATGAFVLLMSLLVSFKHRQNLQRLWNGTESRFEKARLIHRWLQR